jgi:hypothetical protein
MCLVGWSARIFLIFAVKDEPDVGQDGCPFWKIVPLINVVFAKSVRETCA